MTCSYVRSLLDDLVDQELATEIETSLNQHLQGCPQCQAEYEALVSLKQMLSGLACPEPPAGYWDEVNDIILARTVEAEAVTDVRESADRRQRELSSFYRSLVAVAASLAIFVTSLWLGSSEQPGFGSQAPQWSLTETEQNSVAAATTKHISTDEQDLIAGGMLLVGTPGMFTSPADMAAVLGFDRTR
jgi:predicted anti-sigma-YlaC factor YlaD